MELNYTNFTNNSQLQDCVLQSAIKSPYFQGVLYSVYSLIFVLSLFGNGFVCYIVISFPRMRTVTNYFIMNLAIGDILITLFCVPFSVYSYIEQYWPFDSLMCHVVNYSQGVSVFVSSYTLVAISVDRYIAIMWPLRPRLSKRNSAYIILSVWIVATATVLPIAITSKLLQPTSQYNECDFYICSEDWTSIGKDYQKNFTTALLVLQYIIPLMVLLFTYTSIAVMIWCHKIPGEAENCRDQRIARSKRKMVKMMITVVVVYTICWLPLNLFWMLDLEDHPWLRYVWFSVHWFAMSHTCYNPIIYCYMNNRFRAGFYQTLAAVPCFRKWCTSMLLHRQSTSFPLTSLGGTESTMLHRNNTCTTYISMRRKNGNRLSVCNVQAPVRSASMMRQPANAHVANNHQGNQAIRRFRCPTNLENEI